MKRILWLDSLRGFGILLVILGHSYPPGIIRPLIYTFHMPLFFLISGFLWDDSLLSKYNFKTFTISNFKKLITPYFKIACVCLLFWGIAVPMLNICKYKIFNQLPPTSNLNIYSICHQLKIYIFGILYSYGDLLYMPNCSPIWFLTAFFCARCIFFLTRKYSRGRYSTMTIFVVIVLLGNICSKIPLLLWNLNSGVIGCVFMWMGYYFKEMNLSKNKVGLYIIPIGLTAFYYFFGIPKISMGSVTYSNYWIFIVTAASSCLFFVQLFFALRDMLSKDRILRFIGENAIGFFGYDYSANVICRNITFVNSSWLFTFIVKSIGLSGFIKIINRIKIKKYFY